MIKKSHVKAIHDGFLNIFTKEGVQGVDKATGYQYVADPRYTESLSRNMYRSNGIASRIVDRPVGDMTRRWFKVNGDPDGAVVNYLSKPEIRAKQKIKAALTWARVFGGSIAIMLIKDGAETLEEELKLDNIESIEGLQVYDRYRVTWTNADLYEDTMSSKYNTPEYYTVTPLKGSPFKVHETRVLRFDGPLADEKTLSENNWWHESVYRKIETELINYNSSFNAVKSIMDDFIQIILNIDNLQDLVAAGNEDQVKKRLELIDLGRSTINTVLLDGQEKYTKEASSVAGLDSLLQEFQIALSAVTGIPITLLMGRSPAGMNATGDSDIRMYYDMISEAQEDDLLPQVAKLVEISMLAKNGPTQGKIIDEYSIQFNPLWEPTEKEIVETRKIQAETDQIYVSNQVLFPEEVSVSRFGGNEYSIETEIDTEARKDIPKETEEGEEN